MRVPPGPYLRTHLRVHSFLADVPLHDVWPVMLQTRGPSRDIRDVKEIMLAMRNQPTEPELRLWSILRGHQLGGYKFRRQERIGGAIADFFCPQKGLVVEVDGDTHTDPAADARRTVNLEALGFRVVRVTNLEVMQNLEGVWQHLLSILEEMPDRRAPHPNPSPEGEGLKRAQTQSESLMNGVSDNVR